MECRGRVPVPGNSYKSNEFCGAISRVIVGVTGFWFQAIVSHVSVLQPLCVTCSSVAILSQPTSLLLGGGPKFGKAPPLGISRPGGIAKRSSSITIKKVWNEESWSITDPLELVPMDFPLERTHREITDATACEVASRISNTLRLLSVCAEYDCKKAKAKCTTGDCVSFRIRLFAGGDDGLPVVVEVQRRSGSAPSFMRVCRKILDGAEGMPIEAESKPEHKKVPSFMKGPVGGMKCLQGIPMKMDPIARLNGGLEKSMNLLRSKEKDSNVLGIENLCHMTDPLKTRPDIALNACKAVIMEDRCSDIREEVCVVLQKDTFLPEEFDAEEGMSLRMRARHMSLVLLSNSLVLTSKDGCLAEAVKTRKWIGEFLIPTLVDEVKAFETSANNAYEAACGLTSLAACSDVARRVMEDHSAGEDLRSAYEFGLGNHELLANESERALSALGKSV